MTTPAPLAHVGHKARESVTQVAHILTVQGAGWRRAVTAGVVPGMARRGKEGGVGRRGVEGPPKTEASIRDEDLLPPVVEALKAQRAQQARQRMRAGVGAPEVGRDYVFTGPEGGLLNLNYLRDKVWYPALAKAKLRRRTMYQTRHTFASNALAAGEAPSWVSAMLGHTTPEMLFQVYARYIPNRTRRDGSALADRMSAPAEARDREEIGSVSELAG